MYAFSREFCTFPVTEGNKIRHIYSSSRPQQESSQHEIRTFPHTERCEFQKHHHYLRLQTRESSKPNPERQEF